MASATSICGTRQLTEESRSHSVTLDLSPARDAAHRPEHLDKQVIKLQTAAVATETLFIALKTVLQRYECVGYCEEGDKTSRADET